MRLLLDWDYRMKLLMIGVIFGLVSCASHKNPRGIKEANLDGLKYESLTRYDSLRLDPNLKLKSELALCHNENYDEAFDKFKAKLDKNLNNYLYWNQISTCYILKKEYSKAKNFLELAMAQAKTNKQKAVVLNNMGVVYLEKKNYHEAKEVFKEAIKLNGDTLTPRFNLVQIYLHFGIYERAEKELVVLLQKAPTDIDFLNSLAHVKLMKKDYKTALVYFNRIPKQYRSRDDVATNLAMTYYMLGLFEDAKKTLSNADKSNSSYVSRQLDITKRLEKVDGK